MFLKTNKFSVLIKKTGYSFSSCFANSSYPAWHSAYPGYADKSLPAQAYEQDPDPCKKTIPCRIRGHHRRHVYEELGVFPGIHQIYFPDCSDSQCPCPESRLVICVPF